MFGFGFLLFLSLLMLLFMLCYWIFSCLCLRLCLLSLFFLAVFFMISVLLRAVLLSFLLVRACNIFLRARVCSWLFWICFSFATSYDLIFLACFMVSFIVCCFGSMCWFIFVMACSFCVMKFILIVYTTFY